MGLPWPRPCARCSKVPKDRCCSAPTSGVDTGQQDPCESWFPNRLDLVLAGSNRHPPSGSSALQNGTPFGIERSAGSWVRT